MGSGPFEDPRAKNALFDAKEMLRRELEQSDGDRREIERLLDDDSPSVRVSAAAAAAAWALPAAIKALREVRDLDGEGAFSADMLLRQLDPSDQADSSDLAPRACEWRESG
jgi:hypothetical protein